jgi:hypothetical protein
MSDGLQATRALAIYRVERSGVWEAVVIQRHAACFCEAQLCKHIADEYIVYISWLDVCSSYGLGHYLHTSAEKLEILVK